MKYGTFIGRFQIPTIAHFNNIKYALEQVDHLFVVIGTAFGPRSDADPFLGHERRYMLTQGCIELGIDDRRITFLLVDNYPKDEDWAANVRNIITSQAIYDDVKLVGMKKDASSFYLDMFPGWDSIECPKMVNDDRVVSSTHIRRDWIDGEDLWQHESVLLSSTYSFVKEFRDKNPGLMELLANEQEFYRDHSKAWSQTPYPPTFNTSDAAIFCNGFLALIQRAKAPGAGLYALAGGYVNQDETYEDAARREGNEETSLETKSLPLLAAFDIDNPRRSRRGRIFTKVHVFEVPLSNRHLPSLRAADDAANAMWCSEKLVEKLKHLMFEDHWFLATQAFKRYNYAKGKKL